MNTSARALPIRRRQDPLPRRALGRSAARLGASALALWAAGCSSAADDAPARRDSASVSSGAAAAAASGAEASGPVEPRVLPPIGLAVSGDGGWCAAIVADSMRTALQPGTPVAIVLTRGAAASVAARMRGRRAEQCPTAFPQPRWADYVAYDLDVTASDSAALADVAVALLVVDDTRWTRGADGLARADLDRDGRLEDVRRCTADEGEHITLWSARADGGRERRWHEYFDWGAFTEPTCGPGEDGAEPSSVGPA